MNLLIMAELFLAIGLWFDYEFRCFMKISWSIGRHKCNAVLKCIAALSAFYFAVYAGFQIRHWMRVSDLVDNLRTEGAYVYLTGTVPVPTYEEWRAQTPWSELQCVDNNKEVIDFAFLYHREFTRRLSEIGIRGVSECNDNVAIALSQITSLELVNVEGTSVTGRGVIALSTLPRLAILNVSECRIDDAALESLCRCRNLKSLFLARTHVTDTSIATISRINTLEVIGVSGTAISNIGLTSLASISSLRQLDARQTQVSHKGIVEFMRVRPDVSVIHDTHADAHGPDSSGSQF